MAGAWRYHTLADCTRAWTWFPRVGPSERVRALLPACGRTAALALPLLAGPAVATLPVRALAPVLPLIGQPDAFGGGAYALGGPGYGFGGAGYVPGDGFGDDGYRYAGGQWSRDIALSPPSVLVPGGLPAVGTASLQSAGNGLVDNSNGSGRNLGRNQTITQLDQSSSPGRQLERNQGQGSTEQNVPCPPGVAVLAVALLGVVVGRRWV